MEAVQLPPDLFLHAPITVDLKGLGGGAKLVQLQTRHITPKGMLLEIHPPLADVSAFQVNGKFEVEFQFQEYPLPMKLSCYLTRVIRLVEGPPGTHFSLLVLQFNALNANSREILEGHRLACEAAKGKPRGVRVKVRFPVETVGLDVVSNLTACDLSMGGMFVQTEAGLKPGRLLQLNCHLPFQREPTQANAKIVWVGRKLLIGHGIPAIGFGAQFCDVSDKTRVNLALYYARFLVVP